MMEKYLENCVIREPILFRSKTNFVETCNIKRSIPLQDDGFIKGNSVNM